MKKTLILSVLLILLSLVSCSGGDLTPQEIATDKAAASPYETTSERIVKEIESQFETDSGKKEYTTTYGMIQLYHMYSEKWNAVADEYSDKILKIVEENFGERADGVKALLDEMTASYDEYEENAYELYDKILTLRYEGGSILPPLRMRACCNLSKEYALKILDIYDELIFEMG